MESSREYQLLRIMGILDIIIVTHIVIAVLSFGAAALIFYNNLDDEEIKCGKAVQELTDGSRNIMGKIHD